MKLTKPVVRKRAPVVAVNALATLDGREWMVKPHMIGG